MPFTFNVAMAISVLNTVIPVTSRGVAQFLTSIRNLLEMFSAGGGTFPF